MRLLLAEDDAVLRDGLTRSLRYAGYAVDGVASGEDADYMLQTQKYDLVVLDLGLPEMDGLEVLRRFRNRNSETPILLLTARDGLSDRVTGLDRGADDYLTKPFDLPELEARLRALLRRGQTGKAVNELACGALRLDVAGKRAYAGENALDLSAREFAVLETLMLRAGRVASKEQLIEKICDVSEELGDNAIEVYIHRLRKKIEPSGTEIRTIRGLGYLMDK